MTTESGWKNGLDVQRELDVVLCERDQLILENELLREAVSDCIDVIGRDDMAAANKWLEREAEILKLLDVLS